MADFKVSELSLIHGVPIKVNDDISVYPLTLREIDEMRIEEYNSLLNIFLIDKQTLINNNILSEQVEADNYDIVRMYASQDESFKNLVVKSFSMFLKAEIIFIQEVFFVNQGENTPILIDNHLFSIIREVIQKQNYQSVEPETNYKPMNEIARKMMEKEMKFKAKIKQQNQDNGLQMQDIIANVACFVDGLNLFNVWDLTVYQLYESYIKLLMWDNYHNNYQLLPWAGKDNPIKHHWSEKADKNNL